jgi:BASS family bile acid:Na+ symporter
LISNVSLILLVLLITAANIDKVLQVFGTFGILAGLLFIAVGVGIGWLTLTPSASWLLAPASATSPLHL